MCVTEVLAQPNPSGVHLPEADASSAIESVGRHRRVSLAEVALLFFKLGATSFGGPAAHLAMMDDEIVRRRRWMSRDEFLDLVGTTNLIPGPNSTELAIHIGHRRAGWPGLVVAGTCFILPAVLIVTACAWGYVRYQSLPQAEGLLYGVKPVIVAVVLQALWSLGRTALKTRFLCAVAAAGIGMQLLGVNELLVLCAAGIGAWTWYFKRTWAPRGRSVTRCLVWGLPLLAHPGSAAAGNTVSLWPLFGFFLKVGSVLYGSGYVLLAFLRADLVEKWQWLTEAQLLDAVAVGQITPGPLFTTATFIGYVLGGLPGALTATAGIFLPAFFFVAVSGPLVPRVRRSPAAGAVLDGVNAASLALMAVVTLRLTRAAVVDVPTVVLALAAAALLIRFRVNSAWLVLGGAGAGMILRGWIR
jgi:chromate transporter